MKTYTYFILILGLFLSLISCQETKPADTTGTTTAVTTTTPETKPSTPSIPEGTPVTITGQVKGMKADQKIYFDKKTIDATEIVGSTTIDTDGNFDLKTAIPHPGIYRMRLGVKSVYLLLKGNETVQLSATVEGYNIVESKVEGSLHTEDMQAWMNEKDNGKIADFLTKSTTPKPLLDLYLVEKLDIAVHLDLYKKVRDELAASYPNAPYTNQFNSKVLTIEAKLKAQPVAIGREAPEINLPNPDGKKMALSALRGKVVLLDFWASWCVPCRRANPAVVALYKKYKKQGFDIFSVSFDGVDDRRIAQMGNNAERVQQFTEQQKKAWINAIKKDQLIWPNHVSELRSWSSQIGQIYGVNSIPRTFLLDKKGVIRYDNLHGPQLEEAIKKLLAEK